MHRKLGSAPDDVLSVTALHRVFSFTTHNTSSFRHLLWLNQSHVRSSHQLSPNYHRVQPHTVLPPPALGDRHGLSGLAESAAGRAAAAVRAGRRLGGGGGGSGACTGSSCRGRCRRRLRSSRRGVTSLLAETAGWIWGYGDNKASLRERNVIVRGNQ